MHIRAYEQTNRLFVTFPIGRLSKKRMSELKGSILRVTPGLSLGTINFLPRLAEGIYSGPLRKQKGEGGFRC